MTQLNLFSDQKLTLSQAKKLTIQSLNAYGAQYEHWAISFSGGKDSTTLVTFLVQAITEGSIKSPKRLIVQYADTRQEIPPLHLSAMQVLKEVRDRGWEVNVVKPPLDKRMNVTILGRGVIPPNNSTARYCTQQLKLDPMAAALKQFYTDIPGNADPGVLHQSYLKIKRQLKLKNSEQIWENLNLIHQRIDRAIGRQQRFLSINGMRIGESAIRDRRIIVGCSKNGSECGQGWFQRDLPNSICSKLAPILHWRVCHVWDWLTFEAPGYGWDTSLLATVYGQSEDPNIDPPDVRTGCVGCPLVQRDTALENLVKIPEYKYLTPLLEVRSIWAEAREFKNRHRQHGETLKNGQLSKNPCRVGCLTLEARERLFAKLLDIQDRVNQRAITSGKQTVELIDDEERDRITWHIANKTYPQGWTGNEPLGDELLPTIFSNGTVQPLLWN